MYFQRLPLETTYNTRDLGGIPTKNGQMVAWKKLFRSDDISQLSATDRRFLEEYGVGVVIDLRSYREREETTYALEDSSIEIYHVPFMIEENLVEQKVLQRPKIIREITLYDLYGTFIFEQQTIIKELFTIIYNNSDQGILFHCAAGKDRTGILAVLILGLLEVEDSDIIANYETSYTFLSANQALVAPKGFEHLMDSDKKNISKLLPAIKEKYGTIYNYLQECGVSEQMLLEIKKRYTKSFYYR